ncbi:MAG TPA: CZB domain-containing protein [Rhodocyclaceae bacterium]
MLQFEIATACHKIFTFELELGLAGIGPGVRDAASARDDARCKLGQWLHREEARYAHLPGWPALIAAHREFHACAGEMIEQVNAGHGDAARCILEGRYRDASAAVLKAIERLNAEVDTEQAAG